MRSQRVDPLAAILFLSHLQRTSTGGVMIVKLNAGLFRHLARYVASFTESGECVGAQSATARGNPCKS